MLDSLITQSKMRACLARAPRGRGEAAVLHRQERCFRVPGLAGAVNHRWRAREDRLPLQRLHHDPRQFSWLFKAIYNPHDYFSIHIDRRAAPETAQAFFDIIRGLPECASHPTDQCPLGRLEHLPVRNHEHA